MLVFSSNTWSQSVVLTKRSPQCPSLFLPGRYLALYAYKPQKADELELRKGEMYRVMEKCQDGWFKGTSLRSGASGVFPGNYVTPVSRWVILASPRVIRVGQRRAYWGTEGAELVGSLFSA